MPKRQSRVVAGGGGVKRGDKRVEAIFLLCA